MMTTVLCVLQTHYTTFFFNKWPSGIPRIDLFYWVKPGTEVENCPPGKNEILHCYRNKYQLSCYILNHQNIQLFAELLIISHREGERRRERIWVNLNRGSEQVKNPWLCFSNHFVNLRLNFISIQQTFM